MEKTTTYWTQNCEQQCIYAYIVFIVTFFRSILNATFWWNTLIENCLCSLSACATVCMHTHMLVTFASVFFNVVFCWLLLTEICAKQLSGSQTLPVPKQATGGVTQAQICVRNEVRALINLSKPTVSLTNQTSRSICPSEPVAVNKHYNVHYSFVVKGYLSQAVVGGLLSYLLNHLVHFP